MTDRPTKNEYFLEIANVVAKRSTCLRSKVGAIIVKDDHIISTGYNGAPKGQQHCEIRGCLREQLNVPPNERYELCHSVHAETNAVIQAAVHGTSIKGATLYCTRMPCYMCAKTIVNAEISAVIVENDDIVDDKVLDLFLKAGITGGSLRLGVI